MQVKTLVRLELSADDSHALAAIISAAARDAQDHQAVLGTSGNMLGTEAVARLTGYTASTIRSWLARGLPPANPFPQPRQDLGRNHWQLADIQAWQARKAALDARHHRKKRR